MTPSTDRTAHRHLPLTLQGASGLLSLAGYPVAVGRVHGGVGAGEMPLAGYRVVDAFGYDVRAFVLELQVRSSGATLELQPHAPALHIQSVSAGGAVHQH